MAAFSRRPSSPAVADRPGETTPQSVRRFPARRRPRFRGISRCFLVSYGRAGAERPEDFWCGDRSKWAWFAALNECRRPLDQAQSIPPRSGRCGNTAESKGEATPTYGSERGTAPASGGRSRSRHRPRRPVGDDRLLSGNPIETLSAMGPVAQSRAKISLPMRKAAWPQGHAAADRPPTGAGFNHYPSTS